MTKSKVVSQNIRKTGFWANGQKWLFLTIFGQKIPKFEFSKGYHYTNTIEDTQEKTLGSFKPKLMTQVEVISKKPSKN